MTEKLKQLWGQGLLSASQIGREMDRSRNAILGKVWRLGLRGQSKKPAPLPKVKARVRSKQQPSHRARKPAMPINNAVLDNRSADDGVAKQLVDLTTSSCRWPFGDPQRNGFFFCGADGADMACGKPYCPAHMRIAFAGTAR